MIPYSDRPAQELGFARLLLHALPRSYAIVFFSTEARLGWLLLAATWIASPLVGAAGSLAVLLSAALAWCLRAERSEIGSGFLSFNSMLAASAVVLAAAGHGLGLGATALLWAAAVVGALALTKGLQGWFGLRSGLSVQSLPAVVTVYALHFAAVAITGPLALPVIVGASGVENLPPALVSLLQAFASIVFSDAPWVGLVALVGLALSSPLGALMGVAGFAAGAGALAVLGVPLQPAALSWCGYNFVLAGIALGAGYHVPNRASLALAMVGAVVAALLALALSAALGSFQISPGALPFNFAVFALVAGLRRFSSAALVVSPRSMLLPEAAARQAQLDMLRFPHLLEPALLPPFAGERIVTQSFSAALTHRGAWRHALDFEAPGGAGSWDPGDGSLEGCAIYGTAVLAPCAGTVAAVVAHVADNRVGGSNPQENWGNYVILLDEGGTFVMLAHLRPGPPPVVIGQRVLPGALLGQVGNSGRSAVPHLHLQAQEAPVAGAPTRPWVLKHYLEQRAAEEPAFYRLSGVPPEGARVRAPRPDARLHECFTGWLPGEQRYRWRQGASEGESRLRLSYDELGRFRLETLDARSWLILFLSEGVLYAHERGGRRERVLDLLALGLARLPCIAEPTVFWDEKVASAPWLDASRRALHAALDPFLGLDVLEYRYRVAPLEGAFELEAELRHSERAPRAAPRRLRARIEFHHALVALEAEFSGTEPLHVSRVGAPAEPERRG